MKRMPAEWEQHRATWIAWPHCEDDWHAKFSCIEWVYAEITRALAGSEFVEILCQSEDARERVRYCLDMNHVPTDRYRLHLVETNRSWLRDSAPTAVVENGKLSWVAWYFNAWAKYDNYHSDHNVPPFVSKISGLPIISAIRPDNQQPFVLEGGAIETDGAGTLIVTEECLLSEVQERNRSLGKAGYEKAFKEYLGITKTIWLVAGCHGDDTHGHIDDVARFYAPGKVLLAYEENPEDPFHKISQLNEEILKNSTDSSGNPIQVTRLPMPRPMAFGEEPLPSSYANFYIANKAVLVPTFNDPNDLVALNILQLAFPDRIVIGIACTDLILGFGTLHCLTQQEPLISR